MGRERQAWLIVREPEAPERRYALRGARIQLGRDPSCDLTLADSFASSCHAEIVEHRGERTLRDVGSTNGTRVNGRNLGTGQTVVLRDGDIVEVGSTTLTFRAGSAPAPDLGRSGAVHLGYSLVGSPGADTGRSSSAPLAEHAADAIAEPARPPRAPGRLVWRLLWLGVWLALACVAVAGVAWILAPARLSVLVLGSDARPDELRNGARGRTDTMLTVVVERAPASLTLISIPRDLWVDIPGFGQERINVANAVGGPTLARRVAADVLGVPVERSVLIGLQGVRDIVDAAGGIEIDVERPIHDDAYPTDDYGTIVVDIPAGLQRMDGETALRYARTRHQDSDFGRMARQQQVLVATRRAVLHPLNIWRLPAVMAAVNRALETDLGPFDLAALAFAGLADPPMDRLTLGPGLVDDVRGTTGAFLLRPRPELRPRVAAALDPTRAAIDVQNGTGVEGLARQVADRLRARGLRVDGIGTAARRQPSTTVDVRPGLGRAGRRVAADLDLEAAAVAETDSLPTGIDVRVTLGDDRRSLAVR